jgi:hypothetical protein
MAILAPEADGSWNVHADAADEQDQPNLIYTQYDGHARFNMPEDTIGQGNLH